MGQYSGFVDGRKVVDRQVVMRAPAKVNLHLEVMRQRHDGYHDVETILQTIKIFDRLEVTLSEQYLGGEPEIQLTVAGETDVPADATNLCWQAARHFCRQTKTSGRLVIHLMKSIPTTAGLGGGSSDAAAVLKACNILFDKGLEDDELESLGTALGADVPFFIRGGTAMGRGIGSDLTRLPRVGQCQFLIVKPGLNLKTRDVYGELKMGLTLNSAKANIGVIRPLLARFPQPSWPGFNRLEEVVLPAQPVVQRLVHRLRELAPVAMLSGSGAAAFAVFAVGEDLTEMVAEFVEAGLYVAVVGPHPTGVELEDGRS